MVKTIKKVEQPLDCPSCGSKWVITNADSTRRCRRCGHRWGVEKTKEGDTK